MSKRLKISLMILGLVIACLALTLLVFALVPPEGVMIEATLVPTVFTAP